MYFKIGDRVVWRRDGDRGRIVAMSDTDPDRVVVKWDKDSDIIRFNKTQSPTESKVTGLELEEIWDSDLAKSLRELNEEQ